MNKSILVMDTPINCDDCPLKVLDTDLYYTTYACQNVGCKTNDILKNIRYEMNCPLKPLPRKEKGRNWHTLIAKENTYVCGWNDCLDEILGEE